jgi:hypothetical protein
MKIKTSMKAGLASIRPVCTTPGGNPRQCPPPMA